MISIVTGTLNRLPLLPNLLKNTIYSNDKLELVLVDGGSTDGTIEYIKNINHPSIKLIEVGGRSSYPHFMNLGIESSKYEWVCQWNDDVILVNDWNDVIKQIDGDHMFYLFNWKYGSLDSINDNDWLTGSDSTHSNGGFCIVDSYETSGEIVMNYGIYNKKIFREIGMYNEEFKYYYADGDMSLRAYLFGYKYKSLRDVKVCSLIDVPKVAIQTNGSKEIYEKYHSLYKNKILNEKIRKLNK